MNKTKEITQFDACHTKPNSVEANEALSVIKIVNQRFRSMENKIATVYSSGEFCSERLRNSFKQPKKCRYWIIKTLLGMKVADKIDHIFSSGYQQVRTNLGLNIKQISSKDILNTVDIQPLFSVI